MKAWLNIKRIVIPPQYEGLAAAFADHKVWKDPKGIELMLHLAWVPPFKSIAPALWLQGCSTDWANWSYQTWIVSHEHWGSRPMLYGTGQDDVLQFRVCRLWCFKSSMTLYGDGDKIITLSASNSGRNPIAFFAFTHSTASPTHAAFFNLSSCLLFRLSRFGSPTTGWTRINTLGPKTCLLSSNHIHMMWSLEQGKFFFFCSRLTKSLNKALILWEFPIHCQTHGRQISPIFHLT